MLLMLITPVLRGVRQGERPVERRRELRPRRGAAGPDAGGGSEDEQRAAHHVARGAERMVSDARRAAPARLAALERKETESIFFPIPACTSTPPWPSGRSVCIP